MALAPHFLGWFISAQIYAIKNAIYGCFTLVHSISVVLDFKVDNILNKFWEPNVFHLYLTLSPFTCTCRRPCNSLTQNKSSLVQVCTKHVRIEQENLCSHNTGAPVPHTSPKVGEFRIPSSMNDLNMSYVSSDWVASGKNRTLPHVLLLGLTSSQNWIWGAGAVVFRLPQWQKWAHPWEMHLLYPLKIKQFV